jgi:hypothetical protein
MHPHINTFWRYVGEGTAKGIELQIMRVSVRTETFQARIVGTSKHIAFSWDFLLDCINVTCAYQSQVGM